MKSMHSWLFGQKWMLTTLIDIHETGTQPYLTKTAKCIKASEIFRDNVKSLLVDEPDQTLLDLIGRLTDSTWTDIYIAFGSDHPKNADSAHVKKMKRLREKPHSSSASF